MTRETIKEYILQVKSQDGTEVLHNRWEPDILVEVINEIFNYHEAQLKDKDERIKELDCRAYHAEGHISDLHNEYPKHKKFLDTKARSILAMLFWEWRKAKRLFGSLNNTTVAIQCDFEEAYKMLKG